MRSLNMSIVFLLACPFLASATTYYVRSTASGGHSCAQAQTDNDSNAMNSIQAALNCISGSRPGDMVIVHGGTYGACSDSLTIPNASGTNLGSGAITLKAATGDTVWQLGQLESWNTTNANWIIDGINFDQCYYGYDKSGTVGGYMRLQNLEYKRSPHIGLLGGAFSEFHNVRSHDHGNCAGVSAADCWCTREAGGGGQCQGFYLHDTPWLIENSESYNNHGNGISVVYDANSGYTSYIRNNKLHDCAAPGGCTGLQIILTNGTVQIYNNIFYNNTAGGNSSGAYIGTGGSSSRIYNFYNNTVYGNNEGVIWSDGNQSGQIRNNIFWQTGNPGITGTASNNLTNQDPGFKSAAGGDFHIQAAGSLAVGTGANLSTIFTTDAEGLPRPGGTTPWDLGAYAFTTGGPEPNPQPGSIAAMYTFEEGTGTTVNDTGFVTPANTGTWTECAGNACWTTGIVGNFAGSFNGSRGVTISNVTGLHPTGAVALAADIRMTTTGLSGCDVVSLGDSAKIHVDPNGQVSGMAYDGTTWHEPFSTNVNALNGLNHFLGMSYNGTDIRVYLDGAQVAPAAPMSGLISYTLGSTVTIGRHGDGSADYTCTGVIDNVYILDGYCDATCMTNLYNNQVSSPGLSIVHTGWFTTGASSTQLGVTDTDRTGQPITTPLAFRFALRKADAGSLTEYFKPMCITNTGAGFPPWMSAVELTNAFGAQGLRYYADATITQGQATSALLPLEGFTAAAGKTLKNPIDTTSIDGYDPAQRATIAQGQQIEMVYEVEFGSPLVGGNAVQCRLVRENGADLSSYANIKTVTLQGISPPTSVQIGGVDAGGVQQ